jgi:hypothetical protein
MKERDFINHALMGHRLVANVIKQFGGWESFTESAEDVTNHGIDGGYGQFVYYADTVKFYNRNKKDILGLLEEQACDMGMDQFEMLKSFKCMGGLSSMEIADGLFSSMGNDVVKNAMAWYAAEEVCRVYVDYLDGDKNKS